MLAAFIVNDFASYLKQSLIEESGSDWTTGDHAGSDAINLRSNDRVNKSVILRFSKI